MIKAGMEFLDRTLGRWRAKRRSTYALTLAGGGVTGGMYEVGALTALEERLNGSGRGFDVYVGCSAGSVVAALLAGGVRASEVYRILDGVVETGVPVEIERHGRRLRIVPAGVKRGPAPRKLTRLKARRYLRCTPDVLVHIDWSREWRP